MADQLLDGNLEQILKAYQDDSLSFDAIAARLYADHGIEVTGSTVRTWCAHSPAPEAAS